MGSPNRPGPAAAPTCAWAVELPDEAATERFAEDVGAMLAAGDVVALSGGLGAGKTTFARALLRALAGDPALEVPSPTFPLRIDHVLPRLKVVHADLYRLASDDEVAETGLDEALEDSALLVEWPERLHGAQAENRLDIALDVSGAGRRARIAAAGSWPARLGRSFAIRAFLERSGVAGARRVPIAGDASARAYERVVGANGTDILMNAPARPQGAALYAGRSYDAVAHRALDVRPFVAIAGTLVAAGVRAPAIRAADLDAGLLLLEDLGSEGLVGPGGAPLIDRYAAAIDLLAFMHGQRWPEDIGVAGGGRYRIPRYDREALLVEVSLFPDWFGGHGGELAFPPERRAEFLAAWSDVLAAVDGEAATLVMRDFHAPNILWQAKAQGIARVGVIDFQDALIGHPAYDVASLAQDARVGLTEDQETQLKARYMAARAERQSAFDPEAFERAYAIFAAQRATKVLGGFSRLARVDNKPGYGRHRARLKGLLRRTLRHPVLSPLRLWYEPYL